MVVGLVVEDITYVLINFNSFAKINIVVVVFIIYSYYLKQKALHFPLLHGVYSSH